MTSSGEEQNNRAYDNVPPGCLTATPVPGSNRILLNRIGPSGADLFIADADGTGERKLLPSSGFDYNGSFSSDGNWIFFTSERNGSPDIYRVRLDGSGLEPSSDSDLRLALCL